MTPYHYKARVLPDGHLPLPQGFPARTGEELEVTVSSAPGSNGEQESAQRSEHLLKTWAGVGRGSGAGVAAQHDECLYGR